MVESAGLVRTVVIKRPNVAVTARLASVARSRGSAAPMGIGNAKRWSSAFRDCLYVHRGISLTVGTRQLSDLTTQVQVYEAVLREIAPKLDSQTAQYVERILHDVRSP